ncbi:alpha/beta fold hydrolase [Roseomonas sp. M0104]|uniref:Alpha/beta fold hydrolase n=1 Tax=Teichococcus coralli TaxID=2545983 RepID=A0A845BJJ0_9PROT|nr:alpha/beta fold hydrolase [Pseudoroseomonas coralli]MXP65342.1 alpha/beta fold hydrolase [Pseudoroseomonas coralli]
MRAHGLVAVVLAALLAACVANAPNRTTAGACGGGDCSTASIEENAAPGQPDLRYLLGVVEFDDQGAKLIPAQMEVLFQRLVEESRRQDLCIVVFVHGWKHNAASGDPDVAAFRTLLADLARTEATHVPEVPGRPRRVVGIYAGWRGSSLAAGDLLENLTFWSRKAAAQRVAQGSIRELLGRVRTLRDELNRTSWSGLRLQADLAPPPGEHRRSTRLLTIGHSFGGLIVYTALAQALVDQASASLMAGALHPDDEARKTIAAYGDLMVIVNPAIEATSYEPLRQLVQGRPAASFARGQRPVFIEVTSEADMATGYAFPIGRTANTILENFVSGEQRRQARTAIGHYRPFWTHDLSRAPDAPAPAAILEARLSVPPEVLVRQECEAHEAFEARWRREGHLLPGWNRRYVAGAVLAHRADSGYDANNPFWIVHADAGVIADHSDIKQPIFVDFVRQLYDDLLLDGSSCAAREEMPK